MLTLRNLQAGYGPIQALRGIEIEIGRGEIVCIIGNNGAGKSTTLMTISGIVKPRSGSIIFEDSDITGLPPHEVVRLGISQVPEGRRIFPKLTVRENLELGAFSERKADIRAASDLIFSLFPVLKDRQKQLGGTLSGGEQQMLAIGRALMSRPKLLLLDEPSLGLAPIMASKIFKTIRDINREGVTVLLVEQNARAALKLSHRGYVLDGGRVALEGQCEQLLTDERVRKSYLGE